MNAWSAAYASNDAEELCSLMTSRGANAMRDPYAFVKAPGPDHGPYGATCEEAVRNNPAPAGTPWPPPATESGVKLSADGARAFVDQGRVACTLLQQVDGTWLVAALPLPRSCHGLKE